MANIIIIEDEIDLQEAYNFLLTNAGHHVLTAYNGQEGLSSLKNHPVDLILLDINMPIMNGLEFLEHFIPKRKKEKIVIFSNMLDKTVEEEVIEQGVDKVILKSSITPKQLIDLINRLLGIT